MWSDARCKEAKQRCSMLAVRSETNLLPLVPTASPGEQAKTTKAVIATKQHLHVTSSRRPKSTLSAGAHTDIRTHDGMATRIAFASPKHKPLLGLLEVAAGRRATSMLLARSHDLMHFAASSGCSWQRLQLCLPHASRQHWHASLATRWCCG